MLWEQMYVIGCLTKSQHGSRSTRFPFKPLTFIQIMRVGGISMLYDWSKHGVQVFITVLQEHRLASHDTLLHCHDHMRVSPGNNKQTFFCQSHSAKSHYPLANHHAIHL